VEPSRLEDRARILAKVQGAARKRKREEEQEQEQEQDEDGMEVDGDDDAWESASGGNDDDDDDDRMDIDGSTPRKRAKANSGAAVAAAAGAVNVHPHPRAPRSNRQFAGLKNDSQAAKAIKLRNLGQRPRNMLAKAGESDRAIRVKMPKHLYAGKRKGGKTSRR